MSCKAATYCLVVGDWGDKTGTHPPGRLDLERDRADPGGPAAHAGRLLIYNLTAVSCVAVKSCVAIGSAYGEASNNVQIIWTLEWQERGRERRRDAARQAGRMPS